MQIRTPWSVRAGLLIALSAIQLPAQQLYAGTVGMPRAGYFQLYQAGRAPVWVRTQGAVVVAEGRFSHATLQAGQAVQVTGRLVGSMIWASRIAVLARVAASAAPAPALTASAPPRRELRSVSAAPAQAAPPGASGNDIRCDSLRYSQSNGSTELVCTTTLSRATGNLILAGLSGRAQSLRLVSTTSDRMGKQMEAMKVTLRSAIVTGWKLTRGGQLELDFKPGPIAIALGGGY